LAKASQAAPPAGLASLKTKPSWANQALKFRYNQAFMPNIPKPAQKVPFPGKIIFSLGFPLPY
jgi:hypothetical protein